MTIKQYLTKPPIMARPETSETFYLYIVVFYVSVSATLFKEDEHRKQRPIFFIRKSLPQCGNPIYLSRAGGTGPQGSC